MYNSLTFDTFVNKFSINSDKVQGDMFIGLYITGQNFS